MKKSAPNYVAIIATLTATALLAACGGGGVSEDISVSSPSLSATSAAAETSAPPTSTPFPEPGIQLVESGFVVQAPNSHGDRYAPWAVIVSNASSKAREEVEIRALLYDAAGVLVGSMTEYVPVIFAGTTVGIGSDLTQVSAEPATMDIRIDEGRETESEVSVGLTVTGAAFVPEQFASKVTFSVTNPYSQDLESLRSTCIVRDAAGAFVGVATGFVDFLPASTTATDECIFFSSDIDASRAARADVYVAFSNLTTLELE